MRLNRVSHRLQPRQGVSIFLICFVISLLSWTALKLSRTYTLKLEYKIKYYHIPPDIEIEQKSDSIVNVSIKDKGYKILFNSYLYNHKNIHIDASKLIKIKEKSTTFPSKIIEEALNKQQSISYIEQIDLESIKLFYYHKAQKRVPVRSLVEWNAQKQYFVSDSIKIVPDSVWIFGKKEELAHIQCVTTKSTTMNNLKCSYFGQFGLTAMGRSNNRSIEIVPSSVLLSVPIERYTESTIQCKIQNTFDEEFDLKTFPNSVDITFHVAVSKFKQITDSSFAVCLDFSQNIGGNRAPVKICKMPKNIKVMKTAPMEVEYLKVRK